MNESSSPARFPTTQWSRVAIAGGPPTLEARGALAELCGAYWYPIYALIRRKGHDADAALDLTQDYFARLLEKGTVAAADRARGRFRSFLLADCCYFLADRRDRDRALKRGGGRPVLSIDARGAEGRFLREPSHDRTPERMFEREWALALIARAFDELERHDAEAGRSDLFRRLRPMVAPGSDAAPRAAGDDEASIRYRIDGEIARGGMGAVLKGRDPDLGREVALRVLRDDYRDGADMVRRFVEEAQIGGQLQHPGIVPIYELGAMGDLRPFFAMKPVKGHTLAQLLESRKRPDDDRPRFLSIFEAVCQTMAYAHARGVIHRDLKPSNVMSGPSARCR